MTITGRLGKDPVTGWPFRMTQSRAFSLSCGICRHQYGFFSEYKHKTRNNKKQYLKKKMTKLYIEVIPSF